jgi:hypothetical protein
VFFRSNQIKKEKKVASFHKSISDAARHALANATIKDMTLYLPPDLPRPLYKKVDAILTELGGKWQSGKVKGHVFDHDPHDDVHCVVEQGQLPPRHPPPLLFDVIAESSNGAELELFSLPAKNEEEAVERYKGFRPSVTNWAEYNLKALPLPNNKEQSMYYNRNLPRGTHGEGGF